MANSIADNKNMSQLPVPGDCVHDPPCDCDPVSFVPFCNFDAAEIAWLPCAHRLAGDSLQWFVRGDKCPICRRVLNRGELARVRQRAGITAAQVAAAAKRDEESEEEADVLASQYVEDESRSTTGSERSEDETDTSLSGFLVREGEEAEERFSTDEEEEEEEEEEVADSESNSDDEDDSDSTGSDYEAPPRQYLLRSRCVRSFLRQSE